MDAGTWRKDFRSFSQPAWDVRGLLQRCFQPLFSVFLYLIVLLPNGTVFHVNVKLLLFAMILPAAVLKMFQNPKVTLLHLGLLVLIPTIFSLWILVAQANRVALSISLTQYRDILVMLVSTWVTGVAIGGDRKTRGRFLKMMLNAEIAACVLKIALLCFATVRGIAVSDLVDTINRLTGADLMGSDFGDNSSLGRIQFTGDGLIPLCFYLLLRYREKLGIGATQAFISFVMLSVSLLLTFSRYFWAFAAVALVLGLLFSKRDRFYVGLVSGLSCLLIASLPIVVPVAMLRFSVDVAGGSDDVRSLQITAMKKYFWDSPLLGHGLGSHTDEIIRNEGAPYVYEVQLLALATQVGICGLALFAALLIYYFNALLPWNRPWRGPLFTAQFSHSVLLCCWIAAGLFNPILLGSSAAISYGAIKAMGESEA